MKRHNNFFSADVFLGACNCYRWFYAYVLYVVLWNVSAFSRDEVRNRHKGVFREIDRPGAQDLATMVHEQGDIVDSIESNIEAASVQVHQGTDQLRQVRFLELCFLL